MRQLIAAVRSPSQGGHRWVLTLKEHAARPTHDTASDIPAEVQAEMLATFLQERLESWVDESIPALRGATPREAVKTRTGRARVVAMLKDQENAMLRQPGGGRVDFSVIYGTLGLSETGAVASESS